MCDARLNRRRSLHRVNSEGGQDFDSASEYIGGNINIAAIAVEPTIEEEDLVSEEEDTHFASEDLQSQPLTIEDYVKANQLLSNTYDINVIELAAKHLLSGRIQASDMVVQSLAYKMQKIQRGKSGVRYLKSWGCFWAGVREIVKSRGLVPFLDHFEVKISYCLIWT